MQIYYFILFSLFLFVLAWLLSFSNKTLCQIVWKIDVNSYAVAQFINELKSINWYQSHKLSVTDRTILACKIFDDFDSNAYDLRWFWSNIFKHAYSSNLEVKNPRWSILCTILAKHPLYYAFILRKFKMKYLGETSYKFIVLIPRGYLDFHKRFILKR